MSNAASFFDCPDGSDPDPAAPVVVESVPVAARPARVTITPFGRGELPWFARRRGLGPYLRAIVRAIGRARVFGL